MSQTPPTDPASGPETANLKTEEEGVGSTTTEPVAPEIALTAAAGLAPVMSDEGGGTPSTGGKNP